MSLVNISARMPIRTIEDWARYGGPQREHQWRDGYSAKECAKAWLRSGQPRVPAELDALFASHPLTRGLHISKAEPETETRLDDFRGKGRCHDVVASGRGPAGHTLVALEAKVAEPFGPLVAEAHAAGMARDKSNAPQRIEQLVAALFGRALDAELRDLRYQLVHAVAGTLIEAQDSGAALAVFIVHQLGSDAVAQSDHLTDLTQFARALAGDSTLTMAAGSLVGPIRVPGSRTGQGYVPGDLPLLLGFAVQ